jgi:hypothetical protein
MMIELIKKQWNYRLFLNTSNQYVLVVLCGSVGLYEVEVRLNSTQIDDYKLKGESVIDKLAEAIRSNPKKYLEK